jgi:hypothetical protein
MKELGPVNTSISKLVFFKNTIQLIKLNSQIIVLSSQVKEEYDLAFRHTVNCAFR